MSNISLTDFSREELLILECHLRYAASRLEQEMGLRRKNESHLFYSPNGSKKNKCAAAITMKQLAGIVRDNRYFTHLARAAAEAAASAQPVVDLSNLITGNPQFLQIFLDWELHRSQLAIAYVQNQAFHPSTKQDLIRALEIEVKFFDLLLSELGRPEREPDYSGWSTPDEPKLPLLFISLPRSLVVG
jgi:hypothetical protein